MTTQALGQALKALPSKDHTDTEQEKGLILTIHPYMAGLSESIQRVCRDFDIKKARRFQPLLNMLGSSITPLNGKR